MASMTDTPGVDTPSAYGTPRTSMSRPTMEYSSPGAPTTREERLARLANEQRIREKASGEISRLRTLMESVNAKEDVDSSLENAWSSKNYTGHATTTWGYAVFVHGYTVPIHLVNHMKDGCTYTPMHGIQFSETITGKYSTEQKF